MCPNLVIFDKIFTRFPRYFLFFLDYVSLFIYMYPYVTSFSTVSLHKLFNNYTKSYKKYYKITSVTRQELLNVCLLLCLSLVDFVFTLVCCLSEWIQKAFWDELSIFLEYLSPQINRYKIQILEYCFLNDISYTIKIETISAVLKKA